MENRTCPVCGIIYQADPTRLKHGRQTTCSRKCSYAFRGAKLSTIEEVLVHCASCNVEIYRDAREKPKYGFFFCSRKCLYKGRGTGLIPHEVSKPYEIPEATRLQQADRIRAQNAQRMAEGRYAHTEETKRKISRTLCGKRVAVRRQKNKYKYKSLAKWPHPGKMGWALGCPQEVRERISAGVLKAISEGRIRRVSLLEEKVGAVLLSLGFSFEAQHGFRRADGTFAALVDFFLPSEGKALEVNGTFWHADPRFYPDGPKHLSQKRTCAWYNRKLKYLKELGIPLVEVWEHDFNQDPEGAVKRALGI